MKFLPLTAENLQAIDEEFRRKKAAEIINQEADQWSLCGAVSDGGANSPSPRRKNSKITLVEF